ncbi:MAG: DUF368 domain-containing protein [Deltaproteobacteria bacterium]|nr:DUF368 domain-containing protein [Deltaproteobacteria bacterium]MBW2129670.1 DUF368 domain-containing protein [Deltaproteobacteria bacterium]MBW2304866.1 DUF368 domain-containing protein [Deltaproteobacteria bacterium]
MKKQVQTPSRRTFRTYFLLGLKGFCMGAADVVPGVSGGTIAFITGIYEELLKSIRTFDLRFIRLLFSRRPGEALAHTGWKFLLVLGAGILTAVFTLAKILAWLLLTHPTLIWSFFFGLVLASAWTVAGHLDSWRSAQVLWMLLGATGAYRLVGMIPVSTPDTPWFLFLSGSIAICAMILPGISGSFILVLLGKYEYILRAVNHRDLLTLVLVGMGAATGLVTFVRLLNWLLKKHRNPTLAVLTGFMLGSLRKVWPWKKTLSTMTDPHGKTILFSQGNILPPHWDSEVAYAVGLALVGFLLVLSLHRLAGKKQPPP